MPETTMLSYLPLNKNNYRRFERVDIYGRMSFEPGLISENNHDEKVAAFRNKMMNHLHQFAADADLDIMCFVLDGTSNNVIQNFGRMPESVNEDHHWEQLYREARQGTLLVRQPGEAYPHLLTLTGKGDLVVSKNMMGGVLCQDQAPKEPGSFAKLLYNWFGYETAGMKDYLMYNHFKQCERRTGQILRDNADRLERDGTLRMEKLPPEDQKIAKRQQYVDKGPLAREVREISGRLNRLNTFQANMEMLPEMLQPAPQGQMYDPALRNCVALLRAGVDINVAEGKREIREGYPKLLSWMRKEGIGDVPKDVDVTRYQEELSKFDSAANDPEKMYKLVRGALNRAGWMCLELMENGYGTSEAFLDVAAGAKRLMDILDRPEYQEMRNKAYEWVGEGGMNGIRGFCALADAYVQGKIHQQSILEEASQPGGEMTEQQKYDSMTCVLEGNWAENILKSGKAGLKVVREVGDEAAAGKSLDARLQNMYANSPRLKGYSERSLGYLATLFADSDALTEINGRTLGDMAPEILTARSSASAEPRQPGGEEYQPIQPIPPSNGGGIQPG